MNRRRFLTGKEVQAMMQAARHGQTGERDYCLILLAFRHGMRISELLDLHYRDLDLVEGRINIRRLKNGFSTVHPLMIDECDAIRCWSQLRAAWKGAQKTDALFISRRGTPLSRQQAYRIIRYAMPVVTNWQREERIPALSRTTSAIETFAIPYAIRPATPRNLPDSGNAIT